MRDHSALTRFSRPNNKQDQAMHIAMMVIGALELAKKLNTQSDTKDFYYDLVSLLICVTVGSLAVANLVKPVSTLNVNHLFCLMGI